MLTLEEKVSVSGWLAKFCDKQLHWMIYSNKFITQLRSTQYTQLSLHSNLSSKAAAIKPNICKFVYLTVTINKAGFTCNASVVSHSNSISLFKYYNIRTRCTTSTVDTSNIFLSHTRNCSAAGNDRHIVTRCFSAP